MPRYVLSGYAVSVSDGLFDPVNLVLNTASGVTSFSYSYLDNDSLIAPDIPGNYSLSVNGTDVTDIDLNVGLTNVKWGAGLSTKFFLAENEGAFVFFVADIAGDRMPDLHRDNSHVFIEFADLVTGGGNIKSGAYRPDQNIPLDDFFNGDLTGSLKHGSQGDDALSGGGGNNVLVAQKGADVVKGKGGADTLMLGRGNDEGYGGAGGDMISGYIGNDRLYGGKGGDTLIGGADNDRLYGQSGADKLLAGRGADRLDGGAGDDRSTGGGGADRFVFADGGDRDRINDFRNGNDRLVLNDNLWNGNLNEAQVVDQFATRGGGNITFDFGGGDVLILRDYTALGTLEDFIDIV